MTTRRVGLIGDPVAHSISPAIQNAAFAARKIDAVYELWQTDLVDLPDRLASLRDPQVIGANVTVPHKRAVMEHLDSVSETAVRAGAVNTIVNRGGRLSGENTDIVGFATSLQDRCPDAAGRAALVLGAGGAARAVVLALAGVGVGRLSVANRNRDRSAILATDLAPIEVTRIGLDRSELERVLPDSGILINATSLGWHPGESPLDLGLLNRLPRNAFVIDLTYRDTELLAAARGQGLETLDGLPMLVYQGAAAFSLWTGMEAPVAEMLAAARVARDDRR